MFISPATLTNNGVVNMHFWIALRTCQLGKRQKKNLTKMFKEERYADAEGVVFYIIAGSSVHIVVSC